MPLVRVHGEEERASDSRVAKVGEKLQQLCSPSPNPYNFAIRHDFKKNVVAVFSFYTETQLPLCNKFLSSEWFKTVLHQFTLI